MMLSTYVVAGLGAYLYARRAGSDIAGSVATSLIWQWSAFMVEQIGHTNIVHTAAVLPWLLWAVDGYLATGQRKRGCLIVALLALQIFAGHQQTFAYSLLLVTAYALVIAKTQPEARKRLGAVAIFLVAGLMLAAVQILPTFELLRNSLRATASYEFVGSFSMPPRFVMTFLAPYVLGGGNGLLFRAPTLSGRFWRVRRVRRLADVDVRRDGAGYQTGCSHKILGRGFCSGAVHGAGPFPAVSPLRGAVSRSGIESVSRIHASLDGSAVRAGRFAGRGLTAIRTSRKSALFPITLIGGAVFLLTVLTVTWWRPAAFHLAREIPVSLMRAPELFLPVFIAGLSVVSLWFFARSKSRRALIGLFLVLALDLFLYGQGVPGAHTVRDPRTNSGASRRRSSSCSSAKLPAPPHSIESSRRIRFSIRACRWLRLAQKAPALSRCSRTLT